MVIGLIGGIASGKSSAAKTLAEWGGHIIDADKLGHQAYLKGNPAFDAVVETFGDDVVADDGEIDRRALGAKVFGNPDALKQLTDIVWPAIHDMAANAIQQHQAQHPGQHIILEAAVLIEAGWQDLVDEIWAVVVPQDVAIQRACARDNLDVDAVKARIEAQLSNEERRAHAHQVIDNAGTPEEMTEQLSALWQTIGGQSS